ncbi:hypothetical protein Tco_1029654 [Tanacetum coccineum]|uniref:Uncharacterized protein n=1 Tax=Tanacetum coccineum TaxID=301880 RepID=A0ABQ5G5A5_9ASTR
MTESKSFNRHPKYMTLYYALMESILADEDAMDQDQGLKKRKISDDAQLSKRPKSIGSSKDTPKSTGKYVQSKETIFEAAYTKMPLNQGDDTGNTDAQPDVEAITKDDWFKKHARPHTPDLELIQGKSVNNEPT